MSFTVGGSKNWGSIIGALFLKDVPGTGKVRGGIVFAFWFTLFVLIVSLVSPRSAGAQHHEVELGGNIISSDGSGYSFPYGGANVAGQVHFFGFDIGGRFAYTNFPKIGTPGGHRTVKGVHVNRRFGDRVFVGANYDEVFGDATSWTKKVDFVTFRAGYRLVGGHRLGPERIVHDGAGRWHREHDVLPGRHEDVFVFSYGQEVKTDAVLPNNTDYWRFGWHHDFPLGAHQALRFGASFSYSRFDQFVFYSDTDANGLRWGVPTGEVQRLSGNSLTASFSYIIKGS